MRIQNRLISVNRDVNEGEIYTIIGEKQNAIARYLEAVRLFADNGFVDEVHEMCNRILSLDSANVEAKALHKQLLHLSN